MISVIEAGGQLVALGTRLRAARLARNEPMAVFAERIGVSAPTLRAMERGAPTVQIGAWASALWALGRLDDLGAVLAARESLLDRARASAKRVRQRAYGRRGDRK
jgi:transcriptional regulator with XRE-family HTH domain